MDAASAARACGRASRIDPRQGRALADPALRLLLATGFCGGFATFSTFMDENAAFLSAELPPIVFEARLW